MSWRPAFVFIIACSSFAAGQQLQSVEVTGPTEALEGMIVSYDCIADFGDDGQLDVTEQAVWEVEPAWVGTIENGKLEIDNLESPVVATVTATFEFLGDVESDSLDVSIDETCQPTVLDLYGDVVNYGVFVVDGVAYLANSPGGLHILDVSDPSNVELLSVPGTPNCVAVDVKGDFAYTVGTTGLSVTYVADPANPAVLGTTDLPGVPRAVRVIGDLAYISVGRSGMRIVDVSDPSVPVMLGGYNANGTAWTIDVSNDVAYLPFSINAFYIVDVSNPDQPSLLTSIDLPGDAAAMHVVDDIGYFASYDPGHFYLFDVSDPSSPVELSSIPVPGTPISITVAQGVAYVVEESNGGFHGLFIVDVTDPLNPTPIGGQATPGSSRQIFVDGDVAYQTDGEFGLRIINLRGCTGGQCYADLNGDGVVNILDFLSFSDAWKCQRPEGDCNQDGFYTILDFVCFQLESDLCP